MNNRDTILKWQQIKARETQYNLGIFFQMEMAWSKMTSKPDESLRCLQIKTTQMHELPLPI
jgi:hypothetical protein